MTQRLLPAVSRSLVIQRVLYTASQLYNGTAMLQLLFRCLVCPDKIRVLSVLHLSLSLPSDPVYDTALWDVMFFAGPNGGTKIVSLFCRSPRCKNQNFRNTGYKHQEIHSRLIRSIRTVAKITCKLCCIRPSVCLSASISTTSTVRISVKVTIGGFYENLSRNSKFG
jgi:hypothetical protein